MYTRTSCVAQVVADSKLYFAFTTRHIEQRGAIIEQPELVNESLTRQQTPSASTELCDDKKGKKRICRCKLVSARKSPEKRLREREPYLAIRLQKNDAYRRWRLVLEY